MHHNTQDSPSPSPLITSLPRTQSLNILFLVCFPSVISFSSMPFNIFCRWCNPSNLYCLLIISTEMSYLQLKLNTPYRSTSNPPLPTVFLSDLLLPDSPLHGSPYSSLNLRVCSHFRGFPLAVAYYFCLEDSKYPPKWLCHPIIFRSLLRWNLLSKFFFYLKGTPIPLSLPGLLISHSTLFFSKALNNIL